MTTDKIEEAVREFWEKETTFPFMISKDDAVMWLRKTLTTLLAEQREEIVRGLEGLRDNPKIIHGRQCQVGKRPCGLTSQDRLADRCETYKKDLEAALIFVREQV